MRSSRARSASAAHPAPSPAGPTGGAARSARSRRRCRASSRGDLVHQVADVLGPRWRGRRPRPPRAASGTRTGRTPRPRDGETPGPAQAAAGGPSSDDGAQAHHSSGCGAGHAARPAQPSCAAPAAAAPRVAGSGPVTTWRSPATRPAGVTAAAGPVGGGRRPGPSVGRVDQVEVRPRAARPRPHRRHDDTLPGPAHRDVEEARLVVPHRPAGGPHVTPRAGHDVDEARRPEQRPADAQVGPHAVLHAGDDDDLPLPSGRGGRGDQRDGLTPRGPRDEGVSGTSWPRTWSRKSTGEAPGRRSVNRAARRTTRGRRPGRGRHARQPTLPAARRPATGPRGRSPPHGPQDPLDGRPLTQGVHGSGEDAAGPPRRSRLGADPVQREGVQHGLGEQNVARPTSPSSSSRRRSDRRSRRSTTASAPPTGEVRTSTTAVGSRAPLRRPPRRGRCPGASGTVGPPPRLGRAGRPPRSPPAPPRHAAPCAGSRCGCRRGPRRPSSTTGRRRAGAPTAAARPRSPPPARASAAGGPRRVPPCAAGDTCR